VSVQTQDKPERSVPEDWKPFPRAGHTPLYYVAGTALRLFYWLYGRWRIVGLENVPKTGAVLLAGNHVSLLDPPMVGAALFGYRRVRFMAKIELWSTSIGHYVMDRIMSFPVKRGTADRPTIRRTLEWLAQGDAIAIFPEGERSEDGMLQPAQPGIALLVQKSGVPVIPVAIVGTYEMWPKGRKSFKRVPLTIAFGKPILFPPDAPRETVTTVIMEKIAELLTENGQPTSPPLPRPPKRAADLE
jgi:1-acyl-sn-glycerol-3-phosphate acyltransferase